MGSNRPQMGTTEPLTPLPLVSSLSAPPKSTHPSHRLPEGLAHAVALLTSAHQVVPEERDAKPQGEHHQVWGDAREESGKARCLCAEIEKGSCCQDPVGMKSHQVVLPGVQLRCLHQLDTEVEPKRGHKLVLCPWGDGALAMESRETMPGGGSLAPTVPSCWKRSTGMTQSFLTEMCFIACISISSHPLAKKTNPSSSYATEKTLPTSASTLSVGAEDVHSTREG